MNFKKLLTSLVSLSLFDTVVLTISLAVLTLLLFKKKIFEKQLRKKTLPHMAPNFYWNSLANTLKATECLNNYKHKVKKHFLARLKKKERNMYSYFSMILLLLSYCYCYYYFTFLSFLSSLSLSTLLLLLYYHFLS